MICRNKRQPALKFGPQMLSSNLAQSFSTLHFIPSTFLSTSITVKMNRPSDSQRQSQRHTAMAKTDPIKGRNDYLISYNAVSAIMWAAVLGWVVLTVTMHGTGKVFANAANFTRMVQTMAGLEIAHSLTGEELTCTKSWDGVQR